MNSLLTTSAVNTLLQSRKDQAQNGSTVYPSLNQGGKIQKNPSGKDLLNNHQKLTFVNNSRGEGKSSSVDKVA